MTDGWDRYRSDQNIRGVIRDMIDVRYAPQMKKNMITVGAVASKGLKMNSQGHERVYDCDKGCQRLELILLEG